MHLPEWHLHYLFPLNQCQGCSVSYCNTSTYVPHSRHVRIWIVSFFYECEARQDMLHTAACSCDLVHALFRKRYSMAVVAAAYWWRKGVYYVLDGQWKSKPVLLVWGTRCLLPNGIIQYMPQASYEILQICRIDFLGISTRQLADFREPSMESL